MREKWKLTSGSLGNGFWPDAQKKLGEADKFERQEMRPGEFRGTVIAVLTGDTFIVKFASKLPDPYAVVVLPVACAPSLSVFLRNKPNEPFGVEALEFLRSILQGKRVEIGAALSVGCQTTFVHQHLGELPVRVSSVKLVDDPSVDIDGVMIANGYARIRRDVTLNRFWRAKYADDEKDAMENRRGFWGEPNPLIDPMVAFEFESAVVAVNGDFSFRLLEPPVDVELAGVCLRDSANLNEFLGERILFHRVSVRVLQRFVTCPLIVSMAVDGHDLSDVLLRQKFAVVNPMTAHFVTKIVEPDVVERVMGFRGTVTKIISSAAVEVRTSFGDVVVKLACVRPPAFDGLNVNEPFGWEAWKLLRDMLLNEQVEVAVQNYESAKTVLGQILVKDENVNEMIVREGLAKLAISRVHPVPKNFDKLNLAASSATAKGIGIFGPPPEHSVTPHIGTIMEVLGPNDLVAWVFSSKVGVSKRVKLIGMEQIAHDFICFCNGIDILKKYLHHDIELLSNGTVIDRKTGEDLRIPLVRNGIFGLQAKCSDKPLLDAQASAQAERLGLWRTTLFKDALKQKEACVVTNVITPTRLAVQFQSDSLSRINSVLAKNPLKDYNRPPQADQICVLKVNGKKYRALPVKDSAKVYLIDYGFMIDYSIGEVYECPEVIRTIGAQCVVVDLAFVKPTGAPVSQAWRIIGDKGYQLDVVSDNIVPRVVLLELAEGRLLQSSLLLAGMVAIDRSQSPTADYQKELLEMETLAKRDQM